MFNKATIENLIKTGIEIKQKEFHTTSPDSGVICPDYISGPIYDKWMNDIKLLADRYLVNYPLYDEIINTYDHRKNSYGIKNYTQMMSYLQSILEDNELFEIKEENANPSAKVVESPKKHLFISHSFQDVDYIKPFIHLLESIGFAGRDYIFCSSISGYKIPTGNNIYEYLKNELNEEPFLIAMLSNNYYASAASLNEMGAAWVKSLEICAILLPGFEYSQISGAIDPSKIWMKIDEPDRLTELKNRLLSYFNIPAIDENRWEEIRNNFITEIHQLAENNKYKLLKQKASLETIVEINNDIIKCIFRFDNDSLTQVSCSKLILNITDFNDNQTNITLNYSDLATHIIYGKEHKRVTINVPKNHFTNYSNYDFNSLKKWSIHSSWTTYTE